VFWGGALGLVWGVRPAGGGGGGMDVLSCECCVLSGMYNVTLTRVRATIVAMEKH